MENELLESELMHRLDELDAAMQGVYLEFVKKGPPSDEKEWRESELKEIREILEEQPLESSSTAHLSLLATLLTYWRGGLLDDVNFDPSDPRDDELNGIPRPRT